MYTFFISCAPYIEDLLEAELQTFKPETLKRSHLGVIATGNLEFAYRTCLWSRLANRVLLLLDKKPLNTADDLYQTCKDINWLSHFDANSHLWINFNGQNSAINHTRFGAQKIKDAIVDYMREHTNERPSIDKYLPDATISAYLKNNEISIFLDLSGESLHKRGLRIEQGAAPIKENLAAAILYRAKWPELAKTGTPLIDPFCGSGTILIEALMIAANIAPGLMRQRHGFTTWKQHDEALWNDLLDDASTKRDIGLSKTMPPLFGYDSDPRVVRIANDILYDAGFTDQIKIQIADLTQWQPDSTLEKSGLIISNPPYGERLSNVNSLAFVYRQFSEKVKTHFSGWKLAFITNEPSLVKAMGLAPDKKYKFKNGNLDCQLYCFSIFNKKDQTKRDNEKVTHLSYGAEMVANRIKKNLKRLKPWLKKQAINCYRVYDADMPEYAVAIDFYDGKLLIQEYTAPKTIAPEKAKERFMETIFAVESVFNCSEKAIFIKQRIQQKKKKQYQRMDNAKQFFEVKEYQAKFWVNLSDYLDSGLFLDHRPLRRKISETVKGKRFLNLFCYTASVSVQAALAGAKSTTSVDLSPTYLDWAEKNFELNQLGTENNQLIQEDCVKWLENNKLKFDIILLDPPTFSNSKRTETILDIQKDHAILIKHAMRALTPQGVLYFSNNFRRFKLDEELNTLFHVNEISKSTFDPDFTRNEKIHRCWVITQ